MCFLLCVSSPVHVSVRVFISLSCVLFSLSNVSTVHYPLCTVSTCPGVHVAMCSHCFVFSLCCVCCVLCSHRVQCVGVVIPWRVSVVCCMLLLCVQDVVLLLYVRMCSV